MVQAMGNIASDAGVAGPTLHETVFNVVSHYCWDRTSKYFSQTLYENDRAWSYITPWFEDSSIKYNDVFPWEQALGDQLQAEKMWVQRRIAYIFSKYRIGAFTGDRTEYNGLAITLAASYTFHITPAIDLYPVGSTGSTDVRGPRTRAGEESEVSLQAGSGATNNYIHGLDWIASLGDLSDMVLTDRGDGTNIFFSVKSERLQVLKVGDADPTKVLFNAIGLAVESPSITEIDARNTWRLGGELSLFNCHRLRVCLFEGSGITGLLLPVGALLTDVSFPSACTTIFLHSLPLLTNARLVLPPLGGIISLYVNNCDQLSPFNIVANILAVSGNKLAAVTILWRGVVQGSTQTLIDLGALNERVTYENGEVMTEEGKPNVEGTVQIDDLKIWDLEAFDIISVEPYQDGYVKALSNLFHTNLYIIYNPETLAPYVKSGLIFHLDGLDADFDNLVWPTRVGNMVFTLNGTQTPVENGGVQFAGSEAAGDKAFTRLESGTIEVVLDIPSGQGSAHIFKPRGAENGRIGYGIHNESNGIMYGYQTYRRPNSKVPFGRLFVHSAVISASAQPGAVTGTYVDGAPGTTTSYSNYWTGSTGNTGVGASYRGKIYQIRIYNRLLSEAEVLANHAIDMRRYGITH